MPRTPEGLGNTFQQQSSFKQHWCVVPFSPPPIEPLDRNGRQSRSFTPNATKFISRVGLTQQHFVSKFRRFRPSGSRDISPGSRHQPPINTNHSRCVEPPDRIDAQTQSFYPDATKFLSRVGPIQQHFVSKFQRSRASGSRDTSPGS